MLDKIKALLQEVENMKAANRSFTYKVSQQKRRDIGVDE